MFRRNAGAKRSFPVSQVSLELYRSPQPDFEDLIALKEQGIKSLVNLREEAVESEFFTRQAGMNYLHLSIVDWTLPTLDQVNRFIEFVSEPANQPCLVHCAAGVGRTGTLVSCYRIARGMTADQALHMTDTESPLRGMTLNAIQQDFVRKFELSRTDS